MCACMYVWGFFALSSLCVLSVAVAKQTFCFLLSPFFRSVGQPTIGSLAVFSIRSEPVACCSVVACMCNSVARPPIVEKRIHKDEENVKM